MQPGDNMQHQQKIVAVDGGRRGVEGRDGTVRVSTPIVHGEEVCTPQELDFLRRFCEAWSMKQGSFWPVDNDGTPVGRYAEHASRIDPEAYVRFEIRAMDWVRAYGVGKEWGAIFELFARMEGGVSTIDVLDWVAHMTGADDDDDTALMCGARLTARYIALRLKDAYQDFFAIYKQVGSTMFGDDGAGVQNGVRARNVAAVQAIENYKRAKGLT